MGSESTHDVGPLFLLLVYLLFCVTLGFSRGFSRSVEDEDEEEKWEVVEEEEEDMVKVSTPSS